MTSPVPGFMRPTMTSVQCGSRAPTPRAALGTLFFLQAEDGIRYLTVTGVQTCALPIFLVGDALQALGFAVLSSEPMAGTAAAARLEMLRVLAGAIGTRGMAGGQAVDLAAGGEKAPGGAGRGMDPPQTRGIRRAHPFKPTPVKNPMPPFPLEK